MASPFCVCCLCVNTVYIPPLFFHSANTARRPQGEGGAVSKVDFVSESLFGLRAMSLGPKHCRQVLVLSAGPQHGLLEDLHCLQYTCTVCSRIPGLLCRPQESCTDLRTSALTPALVSGPLHCPQVPCTGPQRPNYAVLRTNSQPTESFTVWYY
jgi:hypothetical protein